jgi:hypothetical protein
MIYDLSDESEQGCVTRTAEHEETEVLKLIADNKPAEQRRSILGRIRKPAALQVAEAAMRKAREARAAAEVEQRDRIAEMRSKDAVRDSVVVKLVAEVKAAGIAADQAYANLRAEQEKFAPEFLAKLEQPVATARADLEEHLNSIAEIVESLVEGKRFADANSLPAPRIVALSRHLRAHLSSMADIIKVRK